MSWVACLPELSVNKPASLIAQTASDGTPSLGIWATTACVAVEGFSALGLERPYLPSPRTPESSVVTCAGDWGSDAGPVQALPWCYWGLGFIRARGERAGE